MLKKNYDEIVTLIVEKSGLSKTEIETKIQAKLIQLSDLISKEGAAHIIANELGLKLFDTSARLQIKNILPGMRNVEVVGKVTRLFELRNFQSGERAGKVASAFIGDETGQIRLTMWGDMADNISKLKEGTIVKVSQAYVKENNGFKELHMGDKAKIEIDPAGMTVGEVGSMKNVAQAVAERKFIKDLKADDENKEIFGTIVQVFDPRFFEVCPQCGKRTKQKDGAFYCEAHKNIVPKFSYVFNAFLDDGTENIRVVFFKNQAERAFGKTEEELLECKENPQMMEDLKNSILGNQIKIVGRVKKNEMFDRLEFTANMVFTDVNPDEEVKKLDDLVEKI